MEAKTLLVITDGFPQAGTNKHKCNFVKEYVDIVKDAFREVIVISPQPFFPEFLSHIKIFKKYSYNSNFHDYSYDNVRIFYPNFFTLPISFLRNKNPDLALNAALKIIEKYSISFDIIHAHFIHFGGHIGTKLKQVFHKKPSSPVTILLLKQF